MGTHPIFESDFDCLTEWVAVDLDREKRNLEKNQKEVDQEVENGNEAETEKIDHVLEIAIEKIVIAIAIDVAAVVIVNEMIKEDHPHHRQRVRGRIQSVG